MRKAFNCFDQRTYAEADIVEKEIHGTGGVVAPVLRMPVKLDVSTINLAPDEGLELISLSATLRTDHGLELAATVNIGDVIPRSYEFYKQMGHNLVFPLNSVRVAELEKIRAGGDLKFQMDVRLEFKTLQALKQIPGRNSFESTVWGWSKINKIGFQEQLTISRDLWIANVLKGVGYGAIHIIELPAMPIEACASLEHAFKALKQAQEFHKTGFYDDAVGKCRVALDQFFEYEDKAGEDGKTQKVPVLKKHWITKLGQATYDWLNTSLSVVKGTANKSHHSPNAHHSQFDSQMIIAITTTLVAYHARVTGEN